MYWSRLELVWRKRWDSRVTSLTSTLASAKSFSACVFPSTPAREKSGAAEPSSSAEDAAYLEVLRLLREGHEAEGRVAARAYLRSFPTGFRRAEMQRVADGASN